MKLGTLLAKREGFEENFNSVVHDTLTPDEFKKDWTTMIEKHNLQENQYLQHMWEIRGKWAPAYFTDKFFPFMSTTQRSEGMNSLFKDFVHPHESIRNFVAQYEKLKESCLDRDDKQEWKTRNTKPDLWSRYGIEKQASNEYTRNLFEKFQEQLKDSTSYTIKELIPSGRYVIQEEEPSGNKERSYEVRMEISEQTYDCSCRKFQRDGLLCAHVLKVMTYLSISKIPEKYVLKRWTLLHHPQNTSTAAISSSSGLDPAKRKMLKFSSLCKRMVFLASMACKTNEGYLLTHKGVEDLIMQISEMSSAPKQGAPESSSKAKEACRLEEESSSNALLDPPKTITKGRKRKMQRFKSAVEMVVKHTYKCHNCHEEGHNVQTCKKKQSAEPEMPPPTKN